MANAFDQAFEAVCGISPKIRYVAIYREGSLQMREAAGLLHASSSESDKYEELIVNPALLLLARQRGNIDCGGATHVVVGYGNFTQLIVAIPGGHASVAFDLGSNPLEHVDAIRSLFEAAPVEA